MLILNFIVFGLGTTLACYLYIRGSSPSDTLGIIILRILGYALLALLGFQNIVWLTVAFDISAQHLIKEIVSTIVAMAVMMCPGLAMLLLARVLRKKRQKAIDASSGHDVPAGSE
jgi:hypothetical protein